MTNFWTISILLAGLTIVSSASADMASNASEASRLSSQAAEAEMNLALSKAAGGDPTLLNQLTVQRLLQRNASQNNAAADALRSKDAGVALVAPPRATTPAAHAVPTKVAMPATTTRVPNSQVVSMDELSKANGLSFPATNAVVNVAPPSSAVPTDPLSLDEAIRPEAAAAEARPAFETPRFEVGPNSELAAALSASTSPAPATPGRQRAAHRLTASLNAAPPPAADTVDRARRYPRPSWSSAAPATLIAYMERNRAARGSFPSNRASDGLANLETPQTYRRPLRGLIGVPHDRAFQARAIGPDALDPNTHLGDAIHVAPSGPNGSGSPPNIEALSPNFFK